MHRAGFSAYMILTVFATENSARWSRRALFQSRIEISDRQASGTDHISPSHKCQKDSIVATKKRQPTDRLRLCVLVPIQKRVVLRGIIAGELARIRWYFGEIAVAELIEVARLDHRNGDGCIRREASGDRQPCRASPDNHIVVGSGEAWDTEVRSQKPLCAYGFAEQTSCCDRGPCDEEEQHMMFHGEHKPMSDDECQRATDLTRVEDDGASGCA